VESDGTNTKKAVVSIVQQVGCEDLSSVGLLAVEEECIRKESEAE
jgi:hypothetical protein